MDWRPIETAPQDAFCLVYEDGAIRTMMRHEGKWTSPAIAAIISSPWGDRIVGDDAKRLLPPQYELTVLEICTEPTHWMPLPAPPATATPANVVQTQPEREGECGMDCRSSDGDK